MIFQPVSSSSAGNLYLLRDANRTLAIECGIRFSEMKRRLRYRVSELDGVLLSHSHGDHARAAKDVLGASVDIYALKDTFRELGIDETRHRAQSIEPLQAFTVKGHWRVLPFDGRHDVPSLGFLVKAGSEKLLYVTDTAYVPYRFVSLTMIAIEANYSEAILRESEEAAKRKMRSLRSHMSIERVLDFLAQNDLSSVREIQLLHLSDAHSDANRFQRLVMEATGKPVYIAPKTEEVKS